MIPADLPPTATLVEIEPFAGLEENAPEAVCRAAWALLEAQLAACLGPGWAPLRYGTHCGMQVFARARLYLAALDTSDEGKALILIDIDPDLEPALLRRITATAGVAADRILTRLGQLHEVTKLAAPSNIHSDHDDALQNEAA
ncbi:MAG: hypothetical protein AAGH68_02285 [Pseudomonadota bacterium]